LAIAFLALVGALALPAATSAANNPAASVSISSQATFVSAAQIDVYLTVSCAPYSFGGSPGVGAAGVSVNQATPGGSGFAATNFPCDNQNHKIALAVTPGPWQLGTALAQAFACGFECVIQTKQIKIS